MKNKKVALLDHTEKQRYEALKAAIEELGYKIEDVPRYLLDVAEANKAKKQLNQAG